MLEFERDLDEIREHIAELERDAGPDPNSQVARELAVLQLELETRTADIFAHLTPWQRVQLARHPQRPHTQDYIDRLCSDFTELHGDRRYADDPSVVAGLATFEGRSVIVLGHQKGRSTAENVERNFGMAHPEGYRKALRLFDMAERFGRPVLTLLDTPAPAPPWTTKSAGSRGQSPKIWPASLACAYL